jgi:putative component of membrane protein insertase Oxa1/YidC/SpoIIIJ protein YidD
VRQVIDGLLKYLAIAAIRLYQIFGRRLVRRTCLFHPSCSRRAVIYFSRYGFRKGLNLTKEQLSECRANYSLRINPEGSVEMITASGKVISEPDINPRVAARIKMFWGALPDSSTGVDQDI